MARGNDSSRESDLPRHLRKDPAKQRQSLASRFNFSWIGGMAQQLRNALNRENRIEAQRVRRQSEDARKYRESELAARESEIAQSVEHLGPEDHQVSAPGSSGQSSKVEFAEKEGPAELPSLKLPAADADTGADSARDSNVGEMAAMEKGFEDQINAQEGHSDHASVLSADPDADLDADLDGFDDHFDEEDYIAPELAHSPDDCEDEGNYNGVQENIEDAEDEVLETERHDNASYEDLEAQEFDGEALDADDLDAEDVDAEDVDAEDVDEDDMDAELFDDDHMPGYSAEAIYPAAGSPSIETPDVNAEDAFALNEEIYAAAEPSDHEALEYGAEPSSMSVWEATGFDSYSPTISEGHESSDSQAHAHPVSASEQVLESGTEAGPSEPPATKPALSLANDVEPQPVLDQKSVVSSPTPSGDVAARESGGHAVPPSNEPPRAGSRLEPSKRYLGFPFGPALDPSTVPVSKEGALSQSPQLTKESESTRTDQSDSQELSVAARSPAASESNSMLDIHDGHSAAQAHENNPEPKEDPEKQTANINDDDPYAGLWNLFNVGFTVAPSTSPVKEKSKLQAQEPMPESRDSQSSINEEFNLLAQAAHRYMAGSALFGGSTVITKPRRSDDELPAIASSEDQDSGSFNRRVSSIAHDLFSNSPLFGGKHTDSTPEQTATAEGDMLVDQSSQQPNQGHASSGTGLSSASDQGVPAQADNPLPAPGIDTARREAQEKNDDSHDTRELLSNKIVDEKALDAFMVDGNAAKSEKPSIQPPVGESEANGAAKIAEPPQEAASPFHSDAESDSPEKKAEQETSGEHEPKNETVKKQRRVRNRTSPTEDSHRPTSPVKVEAATDLEETEVSQDQTETKKRKRVERTKPLTRAALRAQKEREALKQAQESESEGDPAPKKRRGKSLHKPGFGGRGKNR